MIDLHAVHILETPLVRATHTDVDALEMYFAVRFPTGYRQYITTLGEGIFAGYSIRIYPPWRILYGPNSVTEWRALVNEFWFWDESQSVLSKSEALACIIIGDTLAGDHLIFHPRNASELYVLPLHNEHIYRVGPTLLDALAWLCTSGTLTDPITQRDLCHLTAAVGDTTRVHS